ncbi:MAG: hypothetical protein WBN96_04170 [Gammaproteobacteria bacterium]
MGQQYRIQVLNKNGEIQGHISEKSFNIEKIGKGGFLFLSEEKFEIEDIIKVKLRFPDNHTQQVSGRICHSEAAGEHKTAYIFSVTDGFYSLFTSH